jgi:hypothetical protein
MQVQLERLMLRNRELMAERSALAEQASWLAGTQLLLKPNAKVDIMCPTHQPYNESVYINLFNESAGTAPGVTRPM